MADCQSSGPVFSLTFLNDRIPSFQLGILDFRASFGGVGMVIWVILLNSSDFCLQLSDLYVELSVCLPCLTLYQRHFKLNISKVELIFWITAPLSSISFPLTQSPVQSPCVFQYPPSQNSHTCIHLSKLQIQLIFILPKCPLFSQSMPALTLVLALVISCLDCYNTYIPASLLIVL